METEAKVDWQKTSVIVVCLLAAVAFNAWCMSLVIDNAVSDNMITIMDKFVLKTDYENHIKRYHCD